MTQATCAVCSTVWALLVQTPLLGMPPFPWPIPNAYLTRDGLMGDSADKTLTGIDTYCNEGIDSFYLLFLEEGTEEQIRRFGEAVG